MNKKIKFEIIKIIKINKINKTIKIYNIEKGTSNLIGNCLGEAGINRIKQ